MRAFIDGWRDMNAKYAGEALFSFMFESFPQQGVQARPQDSTAFPWRMESNHFLYVSVCLLFPPLPPLPFTLVNPDISLPVPTSENGNARLTVCLSFAQQYDGGGRQKSPQ
jgi:hypothetical protein